ncbi:hypothetical protein VTP01DRAFT_5633 [Rhizomucor pusillus]|uniref:uncharacterized protein n=1 Tax=Rhizomucor pusillus TaxID=4840 RepID=UPI0037420E77
MDYIVDEEQFRLETLNSHTQYSAQLPLESEKKPEAMQMKKEAKPDRDVKMREASVKRNYTRYSDQDKYEKDPDSIFQKRRKTGRPRILHEEHKSVILECIDENPSVVLDEVMKKLKQIFTELKYLKPIDRNSEEKIQERLDWILWHGQGKVHRQWSQFPKHEQQQQPLGAISAEGLIKCSLRLPQPPSNKKRKRGDGVGQVSKGTVTGHYISFLKATMDEMDQYPHMKGHYLAMDNAPIHTSEDIAKYVESRGFRCAYLPSYSPELNPIEQFWSLLKSKVKRNKFLEKETLMTRIREASNSLN